MLTQRQLEILCYLAEGYTASEIAALTGRSRITIERHKIEINRRLGARSAANAVALAVIAGQLTLRVQRA